MRSIDDALPTTVLQTRPRALIVEEDVSGLLVVRRLLRQTRYHVDTARSAAEARRAMDRCSYSAVVVDDQRLPDATGAELLAEVERRQPEALRLLVADADRARVLDAGVRAGRFRLVPRPFFAQPLLAALKERDPSASGRRRREPSAVTRRPTAPEGEKDLEKTSLKLAALVRRRMLVTLAEVVESRLGGCLGHAVRVSTLAGALAREASLRPDAVEIVEEAALAHDLGELGTDRDGGPAVHQLHRRLSPRETQLMRRHVEASHRIAHRSGLTLAALGGIRHHHERWDGQGYPDKLKSEAIPLVARIVAIADTFDALASGRSYHAAAPLAACTHALKALAGSQLDPTLVKLFVDRKVYQTIDYSTPPTAAKLF
jgi:response regulator RpfG family c-di-GMP phosphodiesterase